MKYIEKTLMSIVLVGLLGGCGETGVVELNSDKVSRSINLTSVSTIQDEGVSYLNSLRADAGMIPFQREYHLEDAAQNHANYLIINNTFSHYESQNASGFTGVAPANRAQFEAYAYAGVGENISSSNASVEKSIDTLFSAIYHRFGFLNFDYDEIGVGFAQSDAYRYG
ncbi:MAG TPA: CAP domain-containing protein, partial [Campylobacterales bacterium]|nr:CAP domain-containing protein [Campylobacterales bacterium]